MEIAHAYNSSYADLARGVKDRVVLITGAASGIGRLATLEYLKLGWVGCVAVACSALTDALRTPALKSQRAI